MVFYVDRKVKEEINGLVRRALQTTASVLFEPSSSAPESDDLYFVGKRSNSERWLAAIGAAFTRGLIGGAVVGATASLGRLPPLRPLRVHFTVAVDNAILCADRGAKAAAIVTAIYTPLRAALASAASHSAASNSNTRNSNNALSDTLIGKPGGLSLPRLFHTLKGRPMAQTLVAAGLSGGIYGLCLPRSYLPVRRVLSYAALSQGKPETKSH